MEKNIFNIKNRSGFIKLALQIFNFQAIHNPVYKKYLQFLEVKPEHVNSLEEIPFLPIRFFKSKQVISGENKPEIIFTSSGTTQTGNSKHYVVSTNIYRNSLLNAFKYFYGSPTRYEFIGLLPSYQEKTGSSLLYMFDQLIAAGKSSHGGFYLNDYDRLEEKVAYLKATGKRKIFILGVSFALLDLAEKFEPDLSGTIVMETGGMKGKRKELTREELHAVLMKKFRCTSIHSEYGMTELLSQSYALVKGKFYSPPWMKIFIRDLYDPFTILKPGNTGGINIIDLANIFSCSFIETSDLGKINPDSSFEVLGRFDQSDIRGCNLMVS